MQPNIYFLIVISLSRGTGKSQDPSLPRVSAWPLLQLKILRIGGWVHWFFGGKSTMWPVSVMIRRHFEWDTRFIWCTNIARRSYVLLAASFPTRAAQCCRVRFTASTWWVCHRAPERSAFSSCLDAASSLMCMSPCDVSDVSDVFMFSVNVSLC